MAESFEEVLANIIAVLNSSQNQLSIGDLCRKWNNWSLINDIYVKYKRNSFLAGDYFSIMGMQIPYKHFGFKSLELLLRSIPEHVRLNTVGGTVFVDVKLDEKTKHITELVRGQKSAKKKAPVSIPFLMVLCFLRCVWLDFLIFRARANTDMVTENPHQGVLRHLRGIVILDRHAITRRNTKTDHILLPDTMKNHHGPALRSTAEIRGHIFQNIKTNRNTTMYRNTTMCRSTTMCRNTMMYRSTRPRNITRYRGILTRVMILPNGT